jgi:hypothetical protein
MGGMNALHCMSKLEQKSILSKAFVSMTAFIILLSALWIAVDNSRGSVGSVTTLSTIYGGASVAWRLDGAYAAITSGNNIIYKFDGADFSTSSVSLSGSVNDAEWKPPSNAYALMVGLDTGTNYASVYKYDGTTCTKVTSGYQVWGNPNQGVSWKPDGSYALIANTLGYLLKYDPVGDSVSLVADTSGYSLWDVEWNPDGSYAICVGQGVYKYTESSFDTLEASGVTGIYRGVSFKSNGTGAMLVTYGGEFRYWDGASVVSVASAGYELWKVHYKPSSNLAIAVGVNNGHICELDGTNVYDITTDASSVGLRGLDWKPDGTYALASFSIYTIKYVPSGGLLGSLIFDKWGYAPTEMAIITVTAISGGVPVPGVSVAMSSSVGGSFNPLYGLTDSNGICLVTYIPPPVLSQTDATITADLSKTGYVPGSGSNTTIISPAIYVSMVVTPSTINLGENASAVVHASVYGYPSTPLPDADVWIGGGWGSWTPSTGVTDSNGDFQAIYSTHHYVAGLEVINAVVSKEDYAGGLGMWNLTTLVPPIVAPTLVAPMDGFVTNVLPTFEWDVVWGAISYEVFVGLRPTVSESDFYWRNFYYSGDFTNMTMSVPLPDGKYYWAVRAVNSSGVWSQFSSAWSFTLRNGGIPGAPVLHTIPSPDSDGSYTLSWDEGSDDIWIKEYIIQESQNLEFADPWEIHTNGTSVSLASRPNGVYWYRACTVDSDGQRGLWSNYVSVQVVHPVSESISLTVTPGSLTIGTGSVLLSGEVSPVPSERRDVKLAVLQPDGVQVFYSLKTESYNYAAYSMTLLPTIAGTHHVTAQLLSASGQVVASTQPMRLVAYSGHGLTLTVDNKNVVVDNNVQISGSLDPPRAGAYVEVTITSPDDVETTENVGLSARGYVWNFRPDAVGTWSISVRWPGDASLPECSEGPLEIDVTGVPKLAILIAGMANPYNGWDWDFTGETNHAYRILLRHGYTKDQIMYLAYTKGIDADCNGLYDDVDLSASSTNLSYAFEDWAKSRLDSSSDLFVYMIDHGSQDIFWTMYVDQYGTYHDSAFSSATLDGWLDALTCRYVVTIIDACYSGSFISSASGSISGSNRVVITSSDDAHVGMVNLNQQGTSIEWSYSGEVFTQLDRGFSYWDAWVLAAAHPNSLSSLLRAGTHPNLDDNGDQVGTGVYNLIPWTYYDGDLADRMGLEFVPESTKATTAAKLAPKVSEPCSNGIDLSGIALSDYFDNVDLDKVMGEDLVIEVPVPSERATNVTLIVIPPTLDYSWDPFSGLMLSRPLIVTMSRANGTNYSVILDSSILDEAGNYSLTIQWAGLDGSRGTIGSMNLSVRPLPPDGISALAGDGYVYVTWNSVVGGVVYKVYRSLNPTDGFELVNVTTDTCYLDTNVTFGVTYYYYVTVFEGGLESPPSGIAAAVAIPEFSNIAAIVLVLLGIVALMRWRGKARGRKRS